MSELEKRLRELVRGLVPQSPVHEMSELDLFAAECARIGAEIEREECTARIKTLETVIRCYEREAVNETPCCRFTAMRERNACAEEIAADCAVGHLCSGSECLSERIRRGTP